MGRRPLGPLKRSCRIMLNLTPAEHAALVLVAGGADQVTQYAREVVLRNLARAGRRKRR